MCTNFIVIFVKYQTDISSNYNHLAKFIVKCHFRAFRLPISFASFLCIFVSSSFRADLSSLFSELCALGNCFASFLSFGKRLFWIKLSLGLLDKANSRNVVYFVFLLFYYFFFTWLFFVNRPRAILIFAIPP